MLQVKKKSNCILKIVFSFFSISFLLFILVILFLNNLKILKTRQFLNEGVNHLKAESIKLSNEGKLLEAKMSAGCDDDLIEISAREDFNLKKQGEQVVAFSSTEIGQGLANPLALLLPIEEPKKSFWQKLIGLFDF